MQEVLEELVRWIGYAVLRLVTLGRYKGGGREDRLREGALGLGLLAAVTYAAVA